MSLPNTVLKIINKRGRIADFEIERIVRSIKDAIVDLSGHRWSPELRARKYARKVADRVYREFYSLSWLKSDFIVKFLNFQPEERKGRLKNAKVTERLTFVIHETFSENINHEDVRKHQAELREFIADEIRSARVDPHYSEGLFPRLNESEIEEIIEFLQEQTLRLAEDEPTPDLLYPHREYIQDMIEKELKDSGEIDIAEHYMVYREGRKKIHAAEISELQFTNSGVHREVVGRILEWNVDHECDTIFALNDWIYGRHGKKLPELIDACEKRYHEDVTKTARDILERRDDVKVVIIAGPSCSNKTTTTVIIGQVLQQHGLKLKQLNVDNYFYDLTNQPKDEFGDYDFEMPEAIDMPLLNENLEALLDGRTIQMPHYNFKEGRRDKYFDFHVESDEIILIDCLHGLYQQLTKSVPRRNKFKIYIESMNVVRNIDGGYTKWADIRMLKRMIRDSQHRGYGAQHTLAHWPYVRKGELKHIIPYIFSTDAVLNSGMPYELPVLKTVLKEQFPTRDFIEKLREQGRLDPYIRGIRVATLLDTVADFPDLAVIPSTSPIREFIGGSSYIIPHNE
ncbi:MAG: hypothetical protein AAB229_03440 [Candidatus Hydrogenedentota bacterium]